MKGNIVSILIFLDSSFLSYCAHMSVCTCFLRLNPYFPGFIFLIETKAWIETPEQENVSILIFLDSSFLSYYDQD